MKRTIKNVVISTITAGLFVGCIGDGNGSSSSTGAGGLPTHGPFVEGTKVKAIELNDNGSDASGYAETEIGADYKFSFSNLTWTGPTKFIIEDGQYYNEATGGFSIGTLSAVEDVKAETIPNVNINILTHLAAQNIINQMDTGTSIADAKVSAKEAIAETFNINLPVGTDLEDLDLTNGDDGEQTVANTQLLQLSAAILETDNPDEIISNLVSDFADDNGVDEQALASLEEVQEKIETIDLSEVASKMETTLNLESVPNTNDVLDGTLKLNHGIEFPLVSDISIISNVGTVSSSEIKIPSNAIYGGSATISIGEIGEYRINGGTWISTGTSGTISNEDTLEVRHTSSILYATSVTSEITIAGIKVPFISTTESDPFVPDSIPNSFSLGFKKDIAQSTPAESDEITVSGINTETDISIIGGEFFLNGSTTASTATKVKNGDKIIVKADASSKFSGVTDATLTIGGVSSTFKVFTTVEDTIPNPISFDVANDDVEKSAVVTSAVKTLTGFNSKVIIKVENGTYKIGDGSFTDIEGEILPDETLTIRHTASDEYSSEKVTIVTIGTQILEFKSTTKADPTANDDTTPNILIFDLQDKKELSSSIISAEKTITGINAKTTVSISEGSMYSINNGEYVSGNGEISLNDTIKIKHTSSDKYQTKTETVLTIGGVVSKFVSYTKTEDAISDAFDFNNKIEIEKETEIISNTVTISGINVAVPISIENGEYQINDGSFTSTAGTISNGQKLTLRHTSGVNGGESTYTKVLIGNTPAIFKSTTVYIEPTISGTPSSEVLTGSRYTFIPTIDAGDDVTSWTISGNPSWMKITPTGTVYGTPTSIADQVVTNDIIVTAINPGVNDTTTTNKITFDVEVKNVVPVLTPESITNASMTQGSSFTYDITLEDKGNDSNVFSLVGAPDFVNINPDTGTISGTAPSANAVPYTFEIKVTDGSNASDTVSVSFTIIEFDLINPSIPTIIGTPSLTVAEDSLYSFTPTANDANSANLIFSIENKPSWATFNTATGQLNGTPTNDNVGTSENIIISVTESGDKVSLASFNIEVTNVNDAPTVSKSVSDITILEDNTFTSSDLRTNFEDSDIGDILTYDITFANGDLLPNWIQFESGILTINPTSNNLGEHLMKITATDKSSEKVIEEFKIIVTNINDAPVGISDTASVDEDGEVLIDVLTNDTDEDAEDTLSIDSITQALNGMVVIDNGQIKYTPNKNFNGTDTFTYIVKDISNEMSEATTVTVTVNAINDAPTTTDKTYTLNTTNDDSYTGTLTASDVDTDETHTFEKVTDPSNGTVIVNTNGSFEYTSNADFSGDDSFTFKANDGDDDSNTSTITISVTDGSTPLNTDVNEAIKKLESIDPEIENIDIKLSDAKDLLVDNTTPEAKIVSLSIALAEIANDDDIASFLFVDKEGSIDLTDTTMLNKVVSSIARNSVTLDLIKNPSGLSTTMTNKLSDMADELKKISDEFGTLFTSDEDVYTYDGENMNYNDSLALRAGLLSVSAELKQIASYQWGSDADFIERSEEIDSITYEYIDLDIDLAGVLNAGTVYKLTDDASSRLPMAKTYLIEAANLLKELPIGYDSDEENNDPGLTQEDKDEIGDIEASLLGTTPLTLEVEDDEDIKEVKVDLSKMYEVATALDITSLGTNWQNLCYEGDMISIEEAKMRGGLECKVIDYYDSFNDVTYSHYESAEPEPQTMPTATNSKIDDIVLSITKIDDTVLTGQDMIDFILEDETKIEALGTTWGNSKYSSDYLVNGNDVTVNKEYGTLKVNAYKADGISSKAQAKKNFSTPKSEIKAKIRLRDVDEVDSSTGRGSFQAVMNNINSSDERIYAHVQLRNNRIQYYIGRYDSTGNTEAEDYTDYSNGNHKFTETSTANDDGSVKFAVSIATSGGDIIFNVSKVDSSGTVIENYDEKVITTDSSFDLGIDEARFRSEVRLSNDDGTLYDQITAPTKLRVHSFSTVSAYPAADLATLSVGDTAILTGKNPWYDIMTINDGSISLKMYDNDNGTYAYSESETFSVNLTDGASTFTITQAGEEGTGEIMNTVQVGDNLFKSDIKFTNTVETTESDTWNWDNHGATTIDELVTLFTNGSTYFQTANTTFMLKSDNTVVKGIKTSTDEHGDHFTYGATVSSASWTKSGDKILVDLSSDYKVRMSFELNSSNKIVAGEVNQIGYVDSDYLYTGSGALQYFENQTGINPNN